MSKLRDYLENIVLTMGDSITVEHRILVAHGVSMKPKRHPLRGTMKSGECYANAYALAASETAYRYCEGYATTKGLEIPLAHAWVIDKDLRVIDPTWKEGHHYFGVVFSPMFMYKTVARTKHHGIFGNLYRLRMKHDCIEQYVLNGLHLITGKSANKVQ